MNDKFEIRKAEIFEFRTLSDLAIRSEAHWGYDKEYMDNFKRLYSLTEEVIKLNPTFVLENQGTLLGFYSINKQGDIVELEHFYIETIHIGKGYGKLLWKHLLELCKGLGIKNIVFVTSPQAKEFYLKMGAKQIGEVESLVIKDRRIPKLEYVIEEDGLF